MISINKRFMYGEVFNDVRCLSTDVKPVEGIKNGSILVEIDTGTVFMFDTETGEWNEMPSGGGGGGGGGDGVTSFNGRRGAVRSRSGDYTASQIGTSTSGQTVQDVIDGALQIDSALSPTSTHAVQNRAIKAKFDDFEEQTRPDTALSTSSAKPVQNSVIAAKFDEVEEQTRPDTALSPTSTKPVQNKVIDAKFKELEDSIQVDATLSTTSQRPVRNSAVTNKFTEQEAKLVPAGGAAGSVLAKTTGSDHALEWKSASDWLLKEDYDSDDDGIVDEAELADAVKSGMHIATAPDKGRDTTIMTDADKGAANGIAPLDQSKKILPEFLPDSIMAGLTYGGVFNATTRVVELTPAAKSILDVSADTMTLENTDRIPEGYPANAELFYITNVGGTFAGMTFAVGDWLISLSTSWRQLQSGNQVSSVNAKTGAVVLDSDDVTQGVVNLYMRTTERAKLAEIETKATRDVNVIQRAEIQTDEDGIDFLHMVNKNGDETDFYGVMVDLADYLKKNGDASDVYSQYTQATSRLPFTGSETLAQFAAKVSGWLSGLKEVAFTKDYDDLDDRPKYNGVTLEGNKLASDLGTLDIRKVTSLPAVRTANTMYVVVDSSTTPATTDFWVQLDSLYHIETGGVVDYNDLDNKPTYNGTTIEGDMVASDLGTLDVLEVNDLPLNPVENTLYVFHTTRRGEPWTQYFVYIDGNWNEIKTSDFEVINVARDPDLEPPTSDGIYVHRWTDSDGESRVQVGLMADGSYERLALHLDVFNDYLQKTGDASEVYAPYEPMTTRQDFTGNERLAQLAAKITGWLNEIKEVGFSNDYGDLDNKPKYNDVELDGSLVASDLGILDVSVVNNMPDEPVANTLYLWRTTKRGEPWTRYFVYTDGWNEIETGGFEVVGVPTDPATTPPTTDAVYVHRWMDSGTAKTQIGIMLNGVYDRIALRSEVITDYSGLTGKPHVDTHELASGNQTHESLGLVGKDDFVVTPTGKTSGFEAVFGDATPSDPIVISEIDDSAEMMYSTVHTSSNHYINTKFDQIDNALAGKVNILFVEELPETPARSTYYYVETEEAGVYDITICDNVGTVRTVGTTEIDLEGIVYDTRKVAGYELDADITVTQLATALKDEPSTLTHKVISADSNTVTDIVTTNLKDGVLATSISETPTDTKIPSEKAIGDYAVKKVESGLAIYGTDSDGEPKAYTLADAIGTVTSDEVIPTQKAVGNYAVKRTDDPSRLYGTNASGVDTSYTLSTVVTSSSADTQVPTAKSVYAYAVPKTTGGSKVYGTDSSGAAHNYSLSTAIVSSSTDNAIPTAKSIYTFAVAKTSNANKVYGTNSSGTPLEYTVSDTYTSTAANQLLTRAGAYGIYSNYCAVSSGTIELASGWSGSISWARMGKVVTMYGSMNRAAGASKVNSWSWNTVNRTTLASNIRPKILSICPAFSDYTANITEVGRAYINNEIQITTAGLIQLNPRNSIGIQSGDFLYWNITYIVA